MADSSPIRMPANANETASHEEVAEAPVVAEAPSSNPTPAPAATVVPPAAAPEKPRKRRSPTRPILFALLPIALVAGGYYYVTGGQIMSTDNAYIQADMVGISTDVSGTVDSIEVHENEPVKKGQVLFRMRQRSFQIALDGAKAQLGVAATQLQNLKASYQQALAQIAQAEADIPYFQTEFDRQQNLINSSVASKSAYDEAKHNLDAAQQKVNVAKAQAATTLSQYGADINQPIEQNPIYQQAQAAVDDAQRQLDDTVVRAPFDGIATNVNSLQVGQYLQTSQAAFALVSSTNLWISASPKETELTYVKPGQKATITVDAYPGVEWKGTVASISPASGSSFSLLPAQNTTGNWVKVVQRIPMRVSIDDMQGKPPLRVGMSTVVDVDTGHARGLPDFINNLLGQPRGQDHE
ncbi:HlyD family secretion protein [Neorhizobium sp. P12A]|uniref:HlyD family secretion protein n=1 Tax=Neorhizobium sp. P12A TaxID=2268027 RepID=UPI0011ED81D9|nr:HlyD family secretion protein [Neorhizobium sp. P12A]KAA0697443.1 HlyD family secretion protein [Neorhizobium sp. P12A]